ncbi:MAG: hypothetical protein EOS32_28790 [Mesorhizobium sp.]|uniref:hypothetical protein n=1 Tax=Mesorhizobium sp. TaxID=1871066 RepID=UPI000FE6046D|nr:hypothetical protein [Mesorhizobium sp.]RWC90049.1 MAG: hypothetical protein EOS32_28790 [Mesorhizobium sp.]
MLARVPWKPVVKAAPRPRALNSDRRRRLIESTATILRTGLPTAFAFEGACRAGLRSALCLEHWPWAEADAAAVDIVATALRAIGAKRPTWLEGQPEHTQEGFAPIVRTFCKRCGGKIPETSSLYGYRSEFCSKECKTYDRLANERRSGQKVGYAAYWAKLSAAAAEARERRARCCEWCGGSFIPRSIVEDIRNCSKSCAAKSTAEKRKRFQACRQCGQQYQASRPGGGKFYCSKACSGASRRRAA